MVLRSSRLARKRPSRAEIDSTWPLSLAMRAKMPISRRPSSWLSSIRSATRSSMRGELADLDRGAERARAQLEVELLVVVAGERLPVADDREVERHQQQGDDVGHPQQPGVAPPDRAQHVELAGGGELAEREQHAEHQPERDRQAGIFRDQVDAASGTRSSPARPRWRRTPSAAASSRASAARRRARTRRTSAGAPAGAHSGRWR